MTDDIPSGANAEDCPQCPADVPYPFTCPGHVDLLAVARQDIIDESQRPPGPPIGLMQVVPPTFAAHQSPSQDFLHSIDDPADPVANLRAAQACITNTYGGVPGVQVTQFDKPVPVRPGETYEATYTAPNSAYQRGMRLAQGRDVPPLPAPALPTRVDDLDSDTYDALRSRYAWLEQRHRDTAHSEQGALLAKQAKEIGDLRELIADFTDSDPCELDHHGYCQAHLWLCGGNRCPHARAKELLHDTPEQL